MSKEKFTVIDGNTGLVIPENDIFTTEVSKYFKSERRFNTQARVSVKLEQFDTWMDEPFTLYGKIADGAYNKEFQKMVMQVVGEQFAEILSESEDQARDRGLIVLRKVFPYSVFDGWNLKHPESKRAVKYDPVHCEEILTRIDAFQASHILSKCGNPDEFRVLTKQDGKLVGNGSGKKSDAVTSTGTS